MPLCRAHGTFKCINGLSFIFLVTVVVIVVVVVAFRNLLILCRRRVYLHLFDPLPVQRLSLSHQSHLKCMAKKKNAKCSHVNCHFISIYFRCENPVLRPYRAISDGELGPKERNALEFVYFLSLIYSNRNEKFTFSMK